PLPPGGRHHFHRHGAEVQIGAPPPTDGPPVVEVGLHGLPHGHPARDVEAFAQEEEEGVVVRRKQVGDHGEAAEQEGKADGQAEPAFSHQAAEVELGDLRPVAEVVVNGLRHHIGIAGSGWLLQMNAQQKRCIHRMLTRRCHDKILGLGVQVLLAEGRRIQTVEQRMHVAHGYRDGPAGLGGRSGSGHAAGDDRAWKVAYGPRVGGQYYRRADERQLVAGSDQYFSGNDDPMWWKALLVWLLLMVLAIVNGTARVKFIVPYTGLKVGLVISTVMLCALILLATWATIGW